MAEEMRRGRSALLAALPPRLQRDVDSYFSRTVEACADVKESLFRGAARMVLHVSVGGERAAHMMLHVG